MRLGAPAQFDLDSREKNVIWKFASNYQQIWRVYGGFVEY